MTIENLKGNRTLHDSAASAPWDTDADTPAGAPIRTG